MVFSWAPTGLFHLEESYPHLSVADLKGAASLLHAVPLSHWLRKTRIIDELRQHLCSARRSVHDLYLFFANGRMSD